MIKNKLSIAFCMIFIMVGCKKNSDSVLIEIELQNEPPLSFNLVDITDDTAHVELSPTLSWQSAKNSNGSEVTYDLYLDTITNPSTIYQSDIDGTSFQLSEKLQLLTTYYWKVVATDFEGKKSQSPIQKFTTRYYNFPEKAITEEAEFSGRFSHATAIFNNKIWLTGGVSSEVKNDVWSSEDGNNWTQVLETTPFSERSSHEMVIFNDKLWVIGGRKFDGPLSDVWSSQNGEDWVQVTALIPFDGRHNHSVVVFDDKMWSIAGTDSSFKPTNQVWYSIDGETWNPASVSAAFSKRTGQAAVTFQNKLWVIGGFSEGNRKNDVWSSDDGTTWKLVTANAAFSPRNAHEAIVFDDKIWVIGGLGGEFGIEMNEVWYSENGVDWVKVEVPDSFSAVAQFSSNIFKEQIWIFGGVNNDDGNEVWATH